MKPTLATTKELVTKAITSLDLEAVKQLLSQRRIHLFLYDIFVDDFYDLAVILIDAGNTEIFEYINKTFRYHDTMNGTGLVTIFSINILKYMYDHCTNEYAYEVLSHGHDVISKKLINYANILNWFQQIGLDTQELMFCTNNENAHLLKKAGIQINYNYMAEMIMWPTKDERREYLQFIADNCDYLDDQTWDHIIDRLEDTYVWVLQGIFARGVYPYIEQFVDHFTLLKSMYNINDAYTYSEICDTSNTQLIELSQNSSRKSIMAKCHTKEFIGFEDIIVVIIDI